MDNEEMQPSPSSANWTATQTYAMAAVCLFVGVLVGYLMRGSAKPAEPAAPASAETQQAGGMPPHGMGQQGMPTMEDMKRMADKQAEPLLAKLKSDPNNVQLLNQTALTYKATHQFKDAIVYFQKALDIDPKNVPVRTDLATCLYYAGDIDGALAQLQKSLSYDPKHAGTLLNIGVITWKGKGDVDKAVAYWEKLLELYPNYEQKDMVQHLITTATQSNGKPTLAEKQPDKN
jgi:cytochrome c-type biogenesis protein CcmH/NrfG